MNEKVGYANLVAAFREAFAPRSPLREDIIHSFYRDIDRYLEEGGVFGDFHFRRRCSQRERHAEQMVLALSFLLEELESVISLDGQRMDMVAWLEEIAKRNIGASLANQAVIRGISTRPGSLLSESDFSEDEQEVNRVELAAMARAFLRVVFPPDSSVASIPPRDPILH